MHRQLVLAALALAVLPASPAAAVGWHAPTSGAVTRGFALGDDPFAAGQHRGADFAAAPGTPVRAACPGRVVVATHIGSSGGVVTIACGRWRVSHLPLSRITARVGAHARAGDGIGTAASVPAHAGIHLGVRRASDRFGYVDPLRFIHPGAPLPPPSPPGRSRRAKRGGPPAAPLVAPRPAPVATPRLAPLMAPRPASARVEPARPLAPWPVWVALAVLLLAAAGGARIRGAVRTRSRGARVAEGRARAAAARHDLPP